MWPLLLCLLQTDPAPSADAPAPERYSGAELVLRSYLALSSVDGRGRRPFRPDAVLRQHLLDPASAPPRAGESVKGERESATWEARTAGEDGRLGELAWAFARVQCEREEVVLARLEGAGTLFVNGAPHQGDLYGFGFGGVPVALVAGENRLFVTGVRGAFRLSLVPCPTGLLFGPWDLTLPTLTVGVAEPVELGLLVLNSTQEWIDGLTLTLLDDDDQGALFVAGTQTIVPGLAPLGTRHVGFRLQPRPGAGGPREPGALRLRLRLGGGGRERDLELELAVRAPGALRTVTRRSPIDGSVQKHALLPPAGALAERARPRLLLSLHGAGVDCEGQAGSYASKPDFLIVAPTNRRPFGFDWQDWGRLDAYEALAHALAAWPAVGRDGVVLSGHSMGGHGTWHLGANDPDGFAALAPSAGWRSFDSYGGRPEGALRELWHAADAASRTEERLANLVQVPTFVLHGEADDNVPASEGHAMVAALEAAGAEPRRHFEPGAGHWWDDASGAPGAACLDWPGFFELFRASTIPSAPRVLDWSSVDPGVDATHHWLSVSQVRVYGRPFRVRARVLEGAEGAARLELVTENVRRLELRDPRPECAEIVLDGQVFAKDAHAFLRESEAWAAGARTSESEKSPARSGPLKRAFERDFVLVVPTAGTPEESASALARARFDQEQWAYRANGDAELVTDAWFLAHLRELHFRNVLLYGNAETNAAWKRVVPADFPVRVRRGHAAVTGPQGTREWSEAGLGVLAVGPRADGPGVFGLLAACGPGADRVAASLALFVSGVGYPDWVVYGPEVLAEGDGGVRAAGFLDAGWRLQAGEGVLGR